MSSSYYKGSGSTAINVRNIVTGSGVEKVGVFEDFPTLSSTNYAKMRPLPLNYSDSSGDLMIASTANNDCYTVAGTKTEAVPSGAKQVRVISLSAGGGAGGTGGGLKVTSNNTNPFYNQAKCYSPGGSGALGGYGNYYYSNSNISIGGVANIDVTVGSGGSAGNDGASKSTKNKSGAKAGDGNSGGNGGPSYIKIANSSYVIVYGGQGGAGGGGQLEMRL